MSQVFIDTPYTPDAQTINNNHIHVLGIAGSLRQRSYNRALLCNAHHLLPPGMTMEIFDLDDIPMFNVDVEARGTPEPVMALRQAMQRADALLIATPEYNWSIPGVLKNALDWASRKGPDAQAPLDGKAVAIMGAGGMYGTVRAQMHLREILGHNDTFVLARPHLMVARPANLFDADGRLTDEATRQRLERLLVALRDWTRQVQN
ncbi:MAG: NAD(P)H-dependent oxidoreductase [Ardenticatenaceae bacterium]|nr:NAD(P)H-dependent oxidoreductase [Ardenticatenaceae bacterium]MCB8986143.1 NAD(P)H-dependent oxidoreductase [Ardenticatenaceae bacterium]